MVETIVNTLNSVPPVGIFVITFLICYIENLFPPSPSDIVLVFVGTMCGIGVVDFVPTVLLATLGSSSGFATAYWIGRKYGRGIISRGWVPFITIPLIDKVETWFNKYHGLIIVGNRFLAGTRAVISFAAGMTHMPFPRTLIYCTVSALTWNSILVWVGTLVGENWKAVDQILSTYGWAVTGIIIALAIVWILVKRRRKSI